MSSTHTPLGVELMATGENAGTWGTKTNTNLQIIEQISGGYKVQTLNSGGAGANTTALTQTDGATGSTVATRVIIFGAVSPETISGNKIVTFPVLTENFYLIKNSTSGSYTVQLKAASGSGATVTWATGDKGWKLVYFDGVATNTGVYDVGFGAATSPGGSNTQVQFNNSGAFGGSDNLTWDGNNLQIGDQGDLRLGDADNSNYVALQAPATVGTNVTLTLPADLLDTKSRLERQWADLVYKGFWFSPLKEALDGFINYSQKQVNGTVRVRLFKGNADVIGRKSKENSLYISDMSTYGSEDKFNHKSADGFIYVWGLPNRIWSWINK